MITCIITYICNVATSAVQYLVVSSILEQLALSLEEQSKSLADSLGFEPKIFFSHSTNSDEAKEIKKAIEDAWNYEDIGICLTEKMRELNEKAKCFLDNKTGDMDIYLAEEHQQPDEDIREKIEMNIENTHFAILFWTRECNSSSWIPYEAGYARGKGKKLIPIVDVKEIRNKPGFLEGKDCILYDPEDSNNRDINRYFKENRQELIEIARKQGPLPPPT